MGPGEQPKTTILLSGRPGCGKTTVIKKTVASLPGKAGGFYTEEVRESGQRMGFALVALTGERGTLAHVRFKGPYQVGKYGVDTDVLEKIGVVALGEASRSCLYLIVDEIGKMEILSPVFRQAVWEAVDRGKVVLGTVMSGPHPWTDALKAHPRVKVLAVTQENRNVLPETLLRELKRLG